MSLKLDNSWGKYLNHHINSSEFKNLLSFIKREYNNHICYPKKELIFSALNNCPFNKIKLVILGQDPYHNPNQANGYAFSVNDEEKIPPSLTNIFIEIENDLNVKKDRNGDLSVWANQGVLLLNSTLTVRKNKVLNQVMWSLSIIPNSWTSKQSFGSGECPKVFSKFRRSSNTRRKSMRCSFRNPPRAGSRH
mgnify:CR=1 FL=1